ncbi:MAG: radical SAM/SPASM domain-containing protein [Isosphaeraceae bacterium]
MNFWSRAVRHARITCKNYLGAPSPPFFIFFINSICNQKCEHCFYWRSLNSKDDLTFEEIVGLSRSLGRIENLNLSGGEPFLRPEFSDICQQFIRHNGVRQIYVPTNGTFKERTIRHVKAILEEKDLDLFVVEHSLDGMPEFHDRFRGQRDGFAKSIDTYDALAEVQKSDPRLRIHAISTATNVNMDEIRRLTTYLFERCPQMDHHNLAMIRGDRKNPALESPRLQEYKELYEYVQRLWGVREHGRYGASVEPLLQWAKGRTAAKQTQVVPCRAGVLSAVVYANGDVSVCENHEPIGNLRRHSFPEIWGAARARDLRKSIRRKECHCTNEVFLWPSIVYQPIQLLRAMIGAKPWRAAPPLALEERAFVPLDALGPLRVKNGAPSASEWKPDQVELPILSEPPA